MKIEFIESYIKPEDGGDYQWNDNHGRLIRCKDCKYGTPNQVYGCRLEPFDANKQGFRMYANDFCSKAELRGDNNEND